MSVLLCVHLKNNVFPLPSPLYQGNNLYLSNALSLLVNFMQKAVTSVRRSWDVGFKKPEL